MTKIAVIYKSRYGTTKQYAQWIAEDLGASLFEASQMKPVQLMDYDVVVYGGALYVGRILGSKLVTQNPCKALVLFTVGLATPEITDFTEIISKNLSALPPEEIKIFHLQGGIDYGRLSLLHKLLMACKKKFVEKTPVDERTSDDYELLDTYGAKLDFTDKEKIKPLVDYVRSL